MTTSTARSAMLFSSLDTFAVDDGPAALALELCSAVGASLTAVLLDLQSASPNPQPPAAGTDAETVNDQVRQLGAAAAGRGIDANIVTTLQHSFGVGGCLSDHLRLHDVGIIGASREGLMSERILAEHLIFEGGRPLIVAPARLARRFAPGRIVAAWDNTRAAARALNDAIALFGPAAEIVLLTVGDDKDITCSLDADEVVETLRRRGLRVTAERHERGRGEIGDALQQAARDLGGDLLVMGGYARSRMTELLLGGATVQVLDDPQLPVLLSH
ncbi:MAG: universal stress protein [Pseudomonadota bacterium]